MGRLVRRSKPKIDSFAMEIEEREVVRASFEAQSMRLAKGNDCDQMPFGKPCILGHLDGDCGTRDKSADGFVV